jgi:hypothetical protein
MSQLVAIQVTAVATAVLAVGAAFTVLFAFLAWRKQSAELNTLQVQVASEQSVTAREADDRHRAQAAHVFVWQERKLIAPSDEDASTGVGARFFAYVRNASDQPAYDVCVTWRVATLKPDVYGPRAVLLPGDQMPSEKLLTPDWPAERFGDVHAEATFRDAAGAKWLRRPDGELIEQKDSEPVEQAAAGPLDP